MKAEQLTNICKQNFLSVSEHDIAGSIKVTNGADILMLLISTRDNKVYFYYPYFSKNLKKVLSNAHYSHPTMCLDDVNEKFLIDFIKDFKKTYELQKTRRR